VPERGIPLFEKRISAPEKALGEQLFVVYISKFSSWYMYQMNYRK
jgi:hypothetical protein